MMTITNITEVIERAQEIITEAVQNCYPYQTDIYMYIDENGTATVVEYQNVSGNSYIDDNHITVCSVPANIDWYGMCYSYYDTFDFAIVLHMHKATLIEETIQYMDEDENYNPSDAEVEDYVKHNDKYMDELKAAYDEWVVVSDFAQSFIDEAENAIIDCLSNLIWASWGF